MLTVSQAAEQLGLSPRVVRYHISAGNLRATAIGGGDHHAGLWAIKPADLARFRRDFPDDRKRRGVKPKSA